MKTRTGNFPIGFRRGGTDWQKDLPSLISWAQANELEVIDLGSDATESAPAVRAAGLRVGSIDLFNRKMISADKAKRAEGVAESTAVIQATAGSEPTNYFLVMLPENPALPRAENFGYMVESFGELAGVLEANQGRLVIEGWPGPGALCCTPENLRAFFKAVPSKAMGINYDPSHLLRMGIDPLRFLHEFGDRAYHVHGKDTEILAEGQYEFGTEQPATFAKPISFGAHAWRYTIPGHGQVRWVEIFRLLVEKGYQGCVSIELEDANFNGPAASEKVGILQGARFLAGV